MEIEKGAYKMENAINKIEERIEELKLERYHYDYEELNREVLIRERKLQEVVEERNSIKSLSDAIQKEIDLLIDTKKVIMGLEKGEEEIADDEKEGIEDGKFD